MASQFHTSQGSVKLMKSRNSDWQECWELLIIPNPTTGWGISKYYPLETDITQELVEQFVHEAIHFL